MIKDGDTYFIFRTSQGIMGKSSTDLRHWTYSGQVFPGNPPSWTTNAVAGFTGFFWAPDVVYQNGQYYLYYACSIWGTMNSAIGLVTSPSLVSPNWTDQGMVIQSVPGVTEYNGIDPCILQDTDGTMWLVFGSYFNGIYITQLNAATGKLLGTTVTRISYNGPSVFNSTEEGPFLCQSGGYYYLFVNWGACCAGIDSTYNIRVGRSASRTGPYRDRAGVALLDGGGTLFLESTARFIGPGQTGLMNDNGTNWLTYHYYDGTNAGTATLGLGQMTWGADGWPVFTNDWSAFYPFNADAHEHLGLYNGTLQNGALITNDPARGKVLGLDGVSQYVSVPDSVANASTFAGWVKWNGGAAWQRVFDFGDGTNQYLFLTPLSAGGTMRFAITTNGNGAEQRIDAPNALPAGSWCHVAVTLDGAQGWLYLDGNPVATNPSVTIRPWQTLARSNYLGKSQWPADPYFSGEMGSLRIFGRALAPSEIKDIALAHPALAHRYSFASNAWDSIGMAHGTLAGNATVTNNALLLSGTSGGCVNLPGGLVSGSSAATVEFWAAFGANGDGARVFDFGNISGSVGQDFFSFSPHTGSGAHQLSLWSGSLGADLAVNGPLDGRTVDVVCISDPAYHYSAIYTNGVLESAQTAALPLLTSVGNQWSFIGRSLVSADAWLNASIDELRLYDGRLTPLEIAIDDQFGPDALALPVSLSVAASASGFTFTWPSFAVGFSLESSATLGSGAVWSPVPGAPALASNVFSVTVSPTNSTRYFRLRQ